MTDGIAVFWIHFMALIIYVASEFACWFDQRKGARKTLHRKFFELRTSRKCVLAKLAKQKLAH